MSKCFHLSFRCLRVLPPRLASSAFLSISHLLYPFFHSALDTLPCTQTKYSIRLFRSLHATDRTFLPETFFPCARSHTHSNRITTTGHGVGPITVLGISLHIGGISAVSSCHAGSVENSNDRLGYVCTRSPFRAIAHHHCPLRYGKTIVAVVPCQHSLLLSKDFCSACPANPESGLHHTFFLVQSCASASSCADQDFLQMHLIPHHLQCVYLMRSKPLIHSAPTPHWIHCHAPKRSVPSGSSGLCTPQIEHFCLKRSFRVPAPTLKPYYYQRPWSGPYPLLGISLHIGGMSAVSSCHAGTVENSNDPLGYVCTRSPFRAIAHHHCPLRYGKTNVAVVPCQHSLLLSKNFCSACPANPKSGLHHTFFPVQSCASASSCADQNFLQNAFDPTSSANASTSCGPNRLFHLSNSDCSN